MYSSKIKIIIYPPKNIDLLLDRYTDALASILIKKIPYSFTDSFIEQLNTASKKVVSPIKEINQ